MATGIIRLSPEALRIEGRQTSIELIPAVEIAAKLPPFRVKKRHPNKESSSRATFVSNAIVANYVACVAPTVIVFSCAINTDDNE